MAYDLFVSYAHEDSAAVERVVAELKAAGLHVWRDQDRSRDAHSITEAIQEGLASSKCFLAWYTRAFVESRACQWELTSAYLAGEHEGDPRARVLVVLGDPDRDLSDLPVSLRDAPVLEGTSVQIAARVSECSASLATTLASIRSSRPRWLGRRPLGSSRFVGRLREMWEIHTLLNASRYAPITGDFGAGVVQVRGLGGAGKTLLLEEYALRYGAAYPGGVFWLDAGGASDREALRDELHRQAAALAQELGIATNGLTPSAVFGELAARMREGESPCLWIVDDFPSSARADDFRAWVGPAPECRTLFSTRCTDFDGPAVDLVSLSPDDAYRLLVSRRPPADAAEEAEARGIVEDLGYHALAVDVASGALSSKGGLLGFAELRSSLTEDDPDVLEVVAALRGELPNGHEKSVASTLLRSLRELEPEGREFLEVASILARAPIPVDLVAKILREESARAGDSPAQADDARRRAMLGVNQVTSLSLAEAADSTLAAYRVHTLVARTVRIHGGRDVGHWRASAVQALSSRLAVQRPGVQDLRRLVHDGAHARALSTDPKSVEEAQLLHLVAFQDMSYGAFASAEQLGSRALAAIRRLGGDEQRFLVQATMHDLALARLAAGNRVEALELYEQVHAERSRELGEGHPLTLVTLDNLGLALRENHRFDDALRCHRRAADGLRALLGERHPDALTAAYNLAAGLAAIGEHGEARWRLVELVPVCEDVLGPDHPDTLIARASLGSVLYDLGDLEAAEEFLEAAASAQELVMGADHPWTLDTNERLARVLVERGETSRGLAVCEEVLAAKRRLLGPEHPFTIQSMEALLAAKMAAGDDVQALRIAEEALEATRRHFGEEDPFVARALNNLGAVLIRRRSFDRAAELLRQSSRIYSTRLGPRHLEVLRVGHNLGQALVRGGKLDEARVVLRRTLDRKLEVLGLEHASTLRTLLVLVEGLQRGKRRAAAAKLLARLAPTESDRERLFALMRRTAGDAPEYG